LMTTSVYQSRDYHVYIPNTYQTRPVSSWKTPLWFLESRHLQSTLV